MTLFPRPGTKTRPLSIAVNTHPQTLNNTINHRRRLEHMRRVPRMILHPFHHHQLVFRPSQLPTRHTPPVQTKTRTRLVRRNLLRTHNNEIFKVLRMMKVGLDSARLN